MARQKGVIRIEGTLDDLTFYHSQDGDLVKNKTSLNGDRIANDPGFIRTRENNAEFGAAAEASKLLRDNIRVMMNDATDNRVISRLTKQMTLVKNLDTTSDRGKRVVGVAIASASAKALLKGFNFNGNALLSSILFSPFTLTPLTGVITINNFVPINSIIAPEGATHLSLSGAFAKVDFVAGTGAITFSNVVNLPINSTSTNVILTPTGVPAGTGTSIYLLKVVFFQMINAVEYSLKNGAYNSMEIVGVA